MDKKVEFRKFILTAASLDKLIFNPFCFGFSDIKYLFLSIWMSIKELNAMTYNLLQKVFSMNPLSIFIDNKCTVLKWRGSASNRKCLIVLVKLNTSIFFLNF